MLRTCGASRKEVFTLPDCSIGLAMRAHRAIRFQGRVSTAQFFLRSLFLEVLSESGVQISGANQPDATFETPRLLYSGDVASDESERTDGLGIGPTHRADVADRDSMSGLEHALLRFDGPVVAE